MKIFKKIISFLIIIIITTTLITNFQNNIYANILSNTNYRKITNAAVLLYSFDDLFMMKLKQSLEEIENENKDKIKFTFYDGKNNISIQNETISSLLNDNIDLFMLNLADIREDIVEDIIHKTEEKNISLVFLDIQPEVVSKVSKYYSKAAFILANSDLAGTIQGKVIVNLWNTYKKALDKNGDNTLQYVLLHGEIDNPAAIDRTKYVLSTINDSGIKTEQLQLINANWLKDIAKESINNLFLKYGDKIEAIIANNDAMAIGAIEALQSYGYNKGDKNKNIAVVGIDALPEAKYLVDKGLMTGTVVQDPKTLAEVFYNVGMNLVNNLSPIENTPYKIIDNEIIIPFLYQEYIKK